MIGELGHRQRSASQSELNMLKETAHLALQLIALPHGLRRHDLEVGLIEAFGIRYRVEPAEILDHVIFRLTRMND